MSEFILLDESIPDAEATDKNGNRFLSGNGHLGLRGTLSEADKSQKPAIMINGLYDKVGSAWREPVNAPNGMFFQVLASGKSLSLRDAVEHRQGIDFRHGIQERRTTYQVDGVTLTLEERRFVSATHERLICAEYVISSDSDTEVVVQSGIDVDVWDINGPHLENIRSLDEESTALIALGVETHQEKVPIVVCETTRGPGKFVPSQPDPKGKYLRSARVNLGKGQRLRFEKFYLVYDGERAEQKRVASELEAFAQQGLKLLEAEHVAAWEARWKLGDVEIEGDREAAFALRFSLYHLLAIAPVFSDSMSIPARGLSGQVYKGAIFWDTEMFMLPYFLATAPRVARTLSKYRVDTLAGAKRKAIEYGYEGAFYAWESQDSGDDACTHFNVNDVFTGRPMRTFFRDKQIHISADIAHALWEYTEVSGDDSLLVEGGAEAIFESARFLASWLHFKVGKKRFEALDVTGPDEYHEGVHNDYFTNVMVRRSFSIARSVDALLREKHPAQRLALLDKMGLSDQELASFGEIADQLYVPKPEAESLLVPQFDGYFSLEDVALEELNTRKLHPNEYFGGGNGLARWTQIIKQADVVLALSLFSEEYSKEMIAKNFEYYEPRTEHGSSLSACAYSIAASRIGRTEDAYRYFMKTATIDITGKSKQYVGDLYIGGTHPAANGGAWLAVVRGMCGIKVAGDELFLAPALPEQFSAVNCTVIVQERVLRLRVESKTLTVSCEQAGAPVTISICGRSYTFEGDKPLIIKS